MLHLLQPGAPFATLRTGLCHTGNFPSETGSRGGCVTGGKAGKPHL